MRAAIWVTALGIDDTVRDGAPLAQDYVAESEAFRLPIPTATILEQEEVGTVKERKILFPTDFSHTGDAALRLATTLAREHDATLLVLHVEEPPAAYGCGEMYYGIPDPVTEDLEKMLAQVLPTDSAVPCEHVMVTGDPASAITRLAEDEGVEMIVMGTHGRTGLMRLLMGSTAEAVVRRATCPVLTYKQPHETASKSAVQA
jgi:nucleotide-binding universal stress UspA family protein